MDSQPLPSASSYSSRDRGDRDGGERRAFTQPTWENARSGSGMGGGMGSSMGGGMGGRGASYGMYSSGSTHTITSTDGISDRPSFAEREQLPLPTRPPYTAHLGNLTYDVSQGDIQDFFKDCEVTNVRIVEDKLDHKPKGFGYVEFATLDGLEEGTHIYRVQFSRAGM